MRRTARLLLYVGTVLIVLGMAKLHAQYIGHYSLRTRDQARLFWTFGYSALLVIASYGVGLPDVPRSSRQAISSATGAPALAAGAISVFQLVSGDALLPRFVVLGSAPVLVGWNLLCVALARGGRVRAEARDRLLLVSQGAEAVALRDELAAHPERHAVLVDHLSPEAVHATGTDSTPLFEHARAAAADVLVLDRAALADEDVVRQAAELHESGLRVRTLTTFYEEWLGKLPISELERSSLLFDIRELHGAGYPRVKRVMDQMAGLLGALVFVLVVPVVLVGNALANRGPLLFRQVRVGKGGKEFVMLKFRTMRAGIDVDSWTAPDDPRITRFGRALRRSHLDEVPQAINILRGDLSLVGPRPEQPHYVDELTAKLPFYELRHLVRPGLTGWAQVKYGYAGDDRDALEKLQYEFWYLRHQSLGLDARIVGRTIRTVVGGGGR